MGSVEAGQDRTAIRKWSKALLGREYRLEVAAAIEACRGEPFTTDSIASTTGIFYPRVQEDLQRLLAAGLIHVTERGRSIEYKAAPSTYWDAAARLLEEAEDGLSD